MLSRDIERIVAVCAELSARSADDAHCRFAIICHNDCRLSWNQMCWPEAHSIVSNGRD